MNKQLKIGAMILIILVCLSFTACNKKTEKEPLTAEQITAELQESITTIDKVISYNEETDVNDRLGRPNQYTSKVNFSDSRIEQYDIEEDPKGGTIEVFLNNKDAQARYDYIENVSSSFSFTKQYMYLQDNVLMRIDFDLTPSQAEEYENALIEILK